MSINKINENRDNDAKKDQKYPEKQGGMLSMIEKQYKEQGRLHLVMENVMNKNNKGNDTTGNRNHQDEQ